MTLDDASVNPATAVLMGKTMMGAMCHCCNLACHHWMKESFGTQPSNHLDQIHAVMLRASLLKMRGHLKKQTPHLPEKQNKRRWMGSNDMATKCVKLHEPLKCTKLFDDLKMKNAKEVPGKEDKAMPRLLDDDNFASFRADMVPCLEKMKKWFVLLQATDIDMSVACRLFKNDSDSVKLKDQSLECKNRLKSDHELVLNKSFASGVQKICED